MSTIGTIFNRIFDAVKLSFDAAFAIEQGMRAIERCPLPEKNSLDDRCQQCGRLLANGHYSGFPCTERPE